MKREVEFVYDFKAFGQAIKKARRAAGYSRKKLGHELNLAPRYLVSIENEGQHPSLQVLYELCTFFDISVDQFFFPDKVASKSTQRRQLETLLDGISDTGLHPNLLSSTHMATHSMIVCNSTSREPGPLFCIPQTASMHAAYIHTHPQANTLHIEYKLINP